MSDNTRKVSQALEMLNLDVRNQKIINDTILKENLTIRDLRKITKQKTENEKNANREHTEKNCDNYLTIERLNNPSVEHVQEQDRQKIKILEKVCLKTG